MRRETRLTKHTLPATLPGWRETNSIDSTAWKRLANVLPTAKASRKVLERTSRKRKAGRFGRWALRAQKQRIRVSQPLMCCTKRARASDSRQGLRRKKRMTRARLGHTCKPLTTSCGVSTERTSTKRHSACAKCRTLWTRGYLSSSDHSTHMMFPSCSCLCRGMRLCISSHCANMYVCS